jgi:hypothetical protein
VCSLAAAVVEFVTAAEAEDGPVDGGVPEPAGEPVPDRVGRGFCVAGVGGEPPEVDLELSEGVQSSQLVAPNLIVPPVFRVAREGVGGQRHEDAQGIGVDQAADERGQRKSFVGLKGVPVDPNLWAFSERCVEALDAEVKKLASGRVCGGPAL